jgi:hypothetical protein
MKMENPKPTCDKCGEVAPVNKDKSNESWTVYDIKTPCKCGGKFKLSFPEIK